jgi:hypothetical protein
MKAFCGMIPMLIPFGLGRSDRRCVMEIRWDHSTGRHTAEKLVRHIGSCHASGDVTPEVEARDDPIATDFIGQFQQ